MKRGYAALWGIQILKITFKRSIISKVILFCLQPQILRNNAKKYIAHCCAISKRLS